MTNTDIPSESYIRYPIGNEPIRVLHVFGPMKGLGGAESRIMDLYRTIDRDRVQFDFLVHQSPQGKGQEALSSDELLKVRGKGYFDDEIRKLGGRIYAIPRYTMVNTPVYKAAVKRFFEEHKGSWQTVQGHITSSAAIYLPIAKENGVRTTCAHVRSAGVDPGIKGRLTDIARAPFKKEGVADYYLAVSDAAGRRVYGDEQVDSGFVKIIPNAIDVLRFKYDEATRSMVRRRLGIENAIVIGHVGRFHEAKNHSFLIRVFAELVKLIMEDDRGRYLLLHGLPLRLMLLGEGPLMDQARELAAELGMSSRILFMGNQREAERYYQAMDYFCFPSLYEGLPGTVVEAQAAGLQCLISDTITREVELTSLVSHMSIEDSPRNWALKILDDLVPESLAGTLLPTDHHKEAPEDIAMENRTGLACLDRAVTSPTIIRTIEKAGFDVRSQAECMTYFYEKGWFPGEKRTTNSSQALAGGTRSGMRSNRQTFKR
ncbi:glycosyltransferase [Butyrivibrio sp. MC2013]|uniref:glycosyltransferase n=1 Tax=Butyrivibrio sp. MC2013 TaxID=1280686 RepID=UPI0004253861|nr:glycosyltransferase [Butyrivibrio sp. MC2013]